MVIMAGVSFQELLLPVLILAIIQNPIYHIIRWIAGVQHVLHLMLRAGRDVMCR